MMPNHNNESIVSVLGKLLGTLKKAKGVISPIVAAVSDKRDKASIE